MRLHRFSAALAGLFAACAPVLAQTYPAEAVILQPEVEVRSGPSKQFMKTTLLKQNDKVLVLRESKEAPGWLEIMPPPGSFSWVNAKDVKQVDASQAFVNGDPSRPVSILPGSRLENKPPDRESIKVTQGTLVVIVNRPNKIGSDTWLPIQPHPNEVRYVPAEAVKATTVVATNNAPINWTLTPSGYTTNSLLAEAEKARMAGDIATAQRLYTQVAQTTADPNQKQLALNVLANMPQGAYTPAQPASRTVLSPGSPAPPASSNLVMQSPAAWSPYGRLQDTKLKADNGQALYALEDAQRKTIIYVTTNPGKSLADYNGRMVSVLGPTMYRSDAVRMQYVVATHVAVP
jgi:hypothetical protein